MKGESIYSIKEHSYQIVSLCSVPHSNQLISADSAGYVKVWEIRNFSCVQRFNVNEDLRRHQTMKMNIKFVISAYIHNNIIFAGNKLVSYEYDKN